MGSRFISDTEMVVSRAEYAELCAKAEAYDTMAASKPAKTSMFSGKDK